MGYTFIKRMGLSVALCFAFFTSFGQLTVVDTGHGCMDHVLHATLLGTAPTGTGLTGDDQYSGIFPIGFTFNFYGVNYNQLVIGSNGVLNFNTALAGGFCPWSITSALLGNPNMQNAICGPWCDILISSGGSFTRSLVGTAPNRKFSVTWCGTAMFSCTAQWTTSQIIIYETSNIIEVHTAHKTICAWNSGAAITGVQNAAGTLATVAPGRDWSPAWSVLSPPEAWRFTPSGATYTVATIPYAPLPYATSAIHWYNVTTGAYLGTGPYMPVTPSGATTYMAAALGCNDSTKAFYTVDPVCLDLEVNTPCIGDTLWLNGAGDSTGATYEWFGPAPYTTPFATTQKAFRFPATAAMTGTYRCIKTVGASKDTAFINVYVHNLPVVTASSNQAICAPLVNPLNLTCSTDTICTAWTWTGPASFTANTQNPSVSPFDLTKQGTYTVSVVSRFGCRSSGSVLVKPGPAPITGPGGVCQYFSITLANAVPTGVWSSTNPTVATISSAGVVNGLTGGTTTISYTLPNGCAISTVVTVHAKPAPPLVPEVRPCQFTPVSALAVTVSGAGYSTTWYGPGVTGPTTFPSGVSTFIPATNLPMDTYYYYVTQTSPFGCVSDSAAFPIRVIAEPSTPSVHDTSYCQFDPLVAPILATGDSLRYYTLATAPPYSGSFTPNVPPTTSAAVITYYVTQTQNGCESPKAPLNVTVYVLPDFEIVAERGWVCQYDSLELKYGGPNYVGAAYLWRLPVGASFANATGPDFRDVMVQFDTVRGKHFVSLEVTNYWGRCSTTQEFEVKVIPAPDAHTYINKDVCLGDTITLALSAHTDNSHTYTWLLDGAPMFSSPIINVITKNVNSGGPYAITFNDSGLHIINVTGFTGEGCRALPNADTFKVHSLPDPRYTVSEIPKKFCVEDSVLFTANVKRYDYNYMWEPDHFFVNQNKPEIWGRVELTNSRVTLTVTDPYGCKASYSKQINPDECCSVTLPNAFTPNGDGLNDRFRPIFDGYRRFHTFRVTNRWGHTVFESANSNPSWDGTYQGVPQDMGTYYYYLRYDCGGKALETKGDVTLVR